MSKTAFLRMPLLLMILGVMLVTSLLHLGNTRVSATSPVVPVKGELTKWEIGELRNTQHVYWNVANTGEAMPKQEIVLTLADKTHKSETFVELANLLGKKTTEETPHEVLSLLGRESWEPVSHSGTEWVNPGRAIKRVDVWLFKRPLNK